MDKRFSTEVVRRCFDNELGGCIEVGPDTDGAGIVEVSTRNEASIQTFGKGRLVMLPAVARLVGRALIQAADEAEEEAKP